MKRRYAIAIISISAFFGVSIIVVMSALGVSWDPTPKPDIPSEEEVSNSLLIRNSNELPEVKAYLERYKDPNVFVQRLYGLDVYYSESQCTLNNEPCANYSSTVEPHSTLIVRMDENTNVEKITLWCVDGEGNALHDKIEHGIVERLKTDTDTCI